jgi:carboxylesterase 2
MIWSPLSDGLINGVIAESGTLGSHDPYTGTAATSYREKEPAEAYGVSFIAELRNVSMDTLLEYAMASDDTRFADTQFANMSSFFQDPPEWRPVIYGYVPLHSYGEALLLGDHADVPILTGNNKDESCANPDEGFNVTTYTTDWSEVFGSEFHDAFIAAYPAGNTTQANHNANDWATGGAQSNVYTYY